MALRLFDVLTLMNPNVSAGQSKLHMAVLNQFGENPLDEFRAGRFDEWQRWQSRRYFERAFVVSIIQLPERDRWLLAGVYVQRGVVERNGKGRWYYVLENDELTSPIAGRIVVSFTKPWRNVRLDAEKWANQLLIEEILREPLSIGDFPGFKAVHLTMDELKVIVRQATESWRTALSSVAGVYLIADKSDGKLYVGSACGEGGIWQRWCSYAATGHGGNVELKKLLKDEGNDHAGNFRFSVLEIADVHASEKDILQRESHWKQVLHSREHGRNKN